MNDSTKSHLAPARMPAKKAGTVVHRLSPHGRGCYRARAELPSVGFPIGGLRTENNSFVGLREKSFTSPVNVQFPVGPNEHGDQRCQHAKSRNHVDKGR